MLVGRARVALQRQAVWIALAFAGVIVFGLYRRSLELAYLFDDVDRLAAIEGQSFWQVLAGVTDGAYQPVPGLMWKVLLDFAGSDNPALFHAPPLLAHAMTGWLLFVLLWRLGFGVWAAVPPLLFLTFPFHYQSVASAGSLAYPLVGAATLTSVILYLHARTLEPKTLPAGASLRKRFAGDEMRWHVAALVATLTALGSHEAGIVSVIAIVGLELGLLVQASRRRPSPWVGAHLIGGVLFAGIWFVVAEPLTVAGFREKALYVLQAITWPVTAQSGWLGGGVIELGLSGLVVTGIACIAASWRWRTLRPTVVVGVALLGAVVATIPVLMLASGMSVERFPRTLYLVGIGASVLWGVLPSLSFRQGRVTRIWRIGALLLLVLVVVQSWRFVEQRVDMMAAGTGMVDEIVESSERYEGRQMFAVNVPSLLIGGSGGYPFGSFDVQLLSVDADLAQVIRFNSARSVTVTVAAGTLFADTSGGPFRFEPFGPELTFETIDAHLRDGFELVVVRPEGNGFAARDAGRIAPGRADPKLRLAGTIAERVQLGDARVAVTGDTLTIFIDWHVEAPLSRSEASLAIVEIRNAAGEPVFTYVGDALGGFSPPILWQAGDLVSDSIVLSLPPDGRYTIHAGMQQVFASEPLPAVGSDGRQYADGMLPIGMFDVFGSRVTVPESER